MIFVKTDCHISKPDALLVKEHFIPDDDVPVFPEITPKLRMIPLSVTSYPGVLARMTAQQAGDWAVRKCKEQNWPLDKDNVESCLANLEMDF